MTPLLTETIRAKPLFFKLLAILAVLIVIHLIAMQAQFNPQFELKETVGLQYWHISMLDLDEEASFGTWYNTGLLVLAAGLFFTIARVLKRANDRWAPWWWLSGVGFLLLSIDEIAGIHEWFNTFLQNGRWTTYALVLLLMVVLAYLPFLWKYRWRTSVLFLLAGLIYVGGAVGMEHVTDEAVNSLHYNMWTAVEEGMEMLGIIVLIYGLMGTLNAASQPDQPYQITLSLPDDKPNHGS